MKRRIIFYFYVFLLSIFIILIIFIYRKITSSSITISPLESKDYIFNPNDGLKYFYEPKPGKLSIDSNFLKQLGYRQGEKIENYINKDGLNQLSDYTEEKPNQTFRILTIGDSFTYGQNINTTDNYPSQLEAQLNTTCKNNQLKDYQVINLGVGGYDIRYVVERYKIKGLKYHPDLVLWFVIDNDFLRINEMLVPRLSKEIKKEKELNRQQDIIGNTIMHIPWRRSIDSILQELGGEHAILNIQKSNFNLLNKYYEGNLVVFSFPTLKSQYFEVLNSFSKSRRSIYIYDKIPNIYNNHKYFLNDNHPTADGYKVIVDDLFQYLIKTKLVPCNQ